MDFEPYVKVHSLVSVHPGSIKLGQMTNLSMIFHMVVSVFYLLKYETRPSSLLNFGTANNKTYWNGLNIGQSVMYCSLLIMAMSIF